MRDALVQAVKDAIVLECKLPHADSGLECSCLTTNNDFCFRNENPNDISKIIYNGIVEFAENEFLIDYEKLELEQLKAIKRRIRYNPSATDDTKLKYGFYGEVLLDLILRCLLRTNVLVARGYFYSGLEGGEPKGFDSFHITESKDKLDLWLGEAKFYLAHQQPIKDILEKLPLTLSDDYLNKNLIALLDLESRFTTTNGRLKTVFELWEENPNINLANELKTHQIRLTYPIFLAYQKNQTDSFYESISKCITYIASACKRINFSPAPTVDYRLFFMFLPLSEVKRIKERVIEWIDSQEPLI